MGRLDPSTDAPEGSARDEEQLVALEPFEEIVGRLEQLKQTESAVVIELDVGTLQFPAASREATICQDRLVGREDERIAILRTQSPETPLLIRSAPSDG